MRAGGWGVVRWRMSCLRACSPLALLLACASPASGGATEPAGTTTTGGTTTGETTTGTTDATEPTTTGGTSGTTTGTTTTSGATTGDSEEEPGNLWLSDRFLNIAHRGGKALRPEETLLAFAHALEVGADVLELDVHASADGVLVAIHDDTVDRTTEGSGAVRDMTLAELKALDAGYWFTLDEGRSYPYRGMGLTIPTVDEIFAAFPEAYFLIEIKQSEPPIVEPLIAALTEHGARERALLASFDGEPLLAVRALAPDVLTSMSTTEMLEFFTNMDNPDYTPPAMFGQPPWELASPELVEFAHKVGVKVQPWTVNTAKAMHDLVALDVDGIMTDDPALLATIAP